MFVTANHEHIVVPWRADLASVMPHARELAYQGARMLLIPNKHDEAKLARNLGVPVPAPILTRYDWRGQKPWAVQRTTSALLTESPRAYVLNEFGTGKTRSVIWAADYLRQSARAGRVLIGAPLSTLTPVWEAELFKVLPRAKVRVLHGTREERLRRLADDADYYVINHHGLVLLRDQLLARKFDIVVFDELAVFRNHSTALWKAANAFARSDVGYCWGLTGSPTPKAPTDAWAQVRLLTPDRVPRSLTRFRDATMRQITGFKWVRRPVAQDIVYDAMQPSVRFALSDIMELPEITYRTQTVDLEYTARLAYKMMFDAMRLKTSNGETITAVNEGVLQSKLLQVACGFIYTDEKKGTFKLPVKPRMDAVVDIASSTSRKFIVFVPFIHALEGVAAALQAAGEDIAVVHGQTPIGLRNKIFREFQDGQGVRGIVAHPACMSHGLNLTAANTVVWYAPVNNFETYEQANARVRRPGQTDKTLIVHLVGTPVERVMYQRLRDRASFQGMLLELFHQQELEF